MELIKVCYDIGLDNEIKVLTPTLEEIIEIVLSLDGKNRTLVTIEGNDKKDNEDFYMAIGGGNNGLYIVFISYRNNTEIYTLVDIEKSKIKYLEIKAGGEITYHPEYFCVSQEKTIAAIKYFYDKKIPDGSLNWEKD
jgi:hypothetical protein